MPKPLTAVIAEDEALLRQALVDALRGAWPDLRIVAECEDGAVALEALAEHRPDIAFLDIRMPGLSGLDVAVAATDVSPQTQVVFVTAYDQYAIDAFEHGAIDYLLKPVTPERLAVTVQRLQARGGAGFGGSEGEADALAVLSQRLAAQRAKASDKPPLTWLTASAGRETRLILIDDVAYFRADNKYTTVVTAEGEALLRKPIRELLEVLDSNTFKQIHRSTIVNLKAIAGIVRDESGKGTVRLRNRPETLTVSQPFMALFRTM
ncbi:LytR/AlgR family response regulator transcription factor [Lysobacter capsici]|jgi:DNA-binding LytR/AlgR family response regulator|uniref:LytR/AlgR family response regulator transcription factor n=1 Tax=Lysobacter capsici TaxID=435897 RepID=UPI00287B8050|nr:LytTR family DNA-binding domain-containing protein [Lysobacter capsici]WND78915.1 LytTR family DNA-binding domain-containing protein [Lysobacter capsici]WND84110.1 LytTR family DNA-binding domain-containing protein [Lysobacter capsici]